MPRINLKYYDCIDNLEVVENTKVEVVAREVEAKAFLAVCAVAVVSILITEEAHGCDEVDVLGQRNLYTWRNAYAPTYLSFFIPIAAGNFALNLLSVDAEAHVEEELDGTELYKAPTSVRVNLEAVRLRLHDSLTVILACAIVIVVEADTDTKIPLV